MQEHCTPSGLPTAVTLHLKSVGTAACDFMCVYMSPTISHTGSRRQIRTLHHAPSSTTTGYSLPRRNAALNAPSLLLWHIILRLEALYRAVQCLSVVDCVSHVDKGMLS